MIGGNVSIMGTNIKAVHFVENSSERRRHDGVEVLTSANQKY